MRSKSLGGGDDSVETETVQGGQGALLDVPSLADGVEVLDGGRAGLDAPQRRAHGVDAEDGVDGAVWIEDDVLRQPRDPAVHRDGAPGRLKLTRHDLQQS